MRDFLKDPKLWSVYVGRMNWFWTWPGRELELKIGQVTWPATLVQTSDRRTHVTGNLLIRKEMGRCCRLATFDKSTARPGNACVISRGAWPDPEWATSQIGAPLTAVALTIVSLPPITEQEMNYHGTRIRHDEFGDQEESKAKPIQVDLPRPQSVQEVALKKIQNEADNPKTNFTLHGECAKSGQGLGICGEVCQI